MMFDEHTYLCLHWCYAHLSTVLELGTYAAEVPVVLVVFLSVIWVGKGTPKACHTLVPV